MNDQITIRPARADDVAAVTAIYEKARRFMRLSGNHHQWSPDYPSAATFRQDLERGSSYVVEARGLVVATFCFAIGADPTYSVIEHGNWLDDNPYGVIHRAASDGTVTGVMHLILDHCFALIATIRVDTHRDNHVMLRSLERYGFRYCGIIHLADGAERLAYQLTLPAATTPAPPLAK